MPDIFAQRQQHLMTISEQTHTESLQTQIYSSFLSREVTLTIILPTDYHQISYPVLWLNDGQDIPSMELHSTLERLYQRKLIQPTIVVGIHANEQRLQEYGAISTPDFKNRGSKASLYAKFFIRELMPYVRTNFMVSFERENNVIAGWSLGGLTALDIAWHYPQYFGKTGVFSGSLWWRLKAYNRGYKDDKHRIMHQQIRNSEKREGLKLWFEVGTQDETADRNKNGVIDVIDDTIDLIKELKAIGYDSPDDIQLVLVKGGEHNQQTWGEVMPYFLKWAFKKKALPSI